MSPCGSSRDLWEHTSSGGYHLTIFLTSVKCLLKIISNYIRIPTDRAADLFTMCVSIHLTARFLVLSRWRGGAKKNKIIVCINCKHSSYLFSKPFALGTKAWFLIDLQFKHWSTIKRMKPKWEIWLSVFVSIQEFGLGLIFPLSALKDCWKVTYTAERSKWPQPVLIIRYKCTSRSKKQPTMAACYR